MRPLSVRSTARDAPDLIGGIDYQALVTVCAWIELEPEELLYLEVEEDFFVVQAQGAQAVQVKRKKAPVTLTGADGRNMIRLAWERQEGAATVYWSTAPAGRDAALYREFALPGPVVWAMAADGDDKSLEAVRRLLIKRGGWPTTLTHALQTLPAPELRQALFQKLRWELAQPTARRLEARAKRLLHQRLTPRSAAPASLAALVLPAALRELLRVARRRSAEDRCLDWGEFEALVEGQLATGRVVTTLEAKSTLGRGPPSLGSYAERLATLSSRLLEAGLEDLSAARRDLDAGRLRAALNVLNRWIEAPPDDAGLFAQVLRARAEVNLVLQDREGAQADLWAASEVDGLSEPGLELRVLAIEDPEAAASRAEQEAPADLWLRIELALMAGDLERTRTLLAVAPASDEGPYEAQLRAMAIAAVGDLPAALAHLEPLLAHSDHAGLRLTAAFLHYAAAQAKGVTVALTRWPAPSDPGLVRSHDAARDHLHAAADLFGLVSEALDDPVQKADRSVWRLACLVDLPEMRAPAETLSHRLLEAHRPHPGAVHWSLARDLPFARATIEAGLRANVESGESDVESVVACATLMMARDARAEALELVLSQVERFEGAERAFLQDWVTRLTQPRSGDSLLSAVEHGRQTGDWNPLAAVDLASRSASERFMALELLASAGAWAHLVEHTEFLIDLDTEAAFALAILARFNAGDSSAALDLIERRRERFGAAPLPPLVEEVEIEALAQAGRLAEALALLETWAPRQSSVRARLVEARLLLTLGDVEALAQRTAEGRFTELPLSERLQLAHEIAPSAPEQARILLNGVDFQEAPVTLAPLAFEAAEYARLDRRQRKAIAKRLFSGEAQDAGIITLASIEDLLARINSQPTDETPPYERGDAPLHIAADYRLGRGFADLLADRRSSHSLLVRSAAADDIQPIRESTLRFDVSGALTAQALGLLDVLETSFERIEVSIRLPSALREIERDLRTSQPDRLDAAEAVLAARNRAELTADPCPEQVIRLGFGEERLGAACGDVVEALKRAGRLRGAQEEPARLALGTEDVALGTELPIGATLLMSLEVAICLAEAGLLEGTLATWRVHTDADELSRLEEECRAQRKSLLAAEEVGRLRRWLAGRLRSGAIATLPVKSVEGRPASSVISSFLDLGAPGAAAIWVEDRALHLRAAYEGHPLVEAVDVLSHLKACCVIGQAAYHEGLRRLRDGGCRFLPIRVDDLLSLLRSAPVVKGEIAETPELSAIRRAFAGDLRSEGWLRLALDLSLPSVESRALLNLHRQLNRVVQAIWGSRAGLPRKRAWSNWAVEAFRCERLERAPIAAPNEPERRNLFELNFIAWLDIGLFAGGSTAHREGAYAWAWARLIAPELEADPSLKRRLPERFTAFWREPFRDEDGEPLTDTAAAREARADLCLQALAAMPEKMRLWLMGYAPLRAFLGRRLARRLSAGGVVLRADPVLEAVRKTLSSGRPRTVDNDGERLRLRRAGPSVVLGRSGGPDISIGGDHLRLLAGNAPDRQLAAERLLADLNLPDAERRPAAEGIAHQPSPYDRLVALNELAASTVEGRLEALQDAAVSGRISVESLLAPPPNMVRRWLHWVDVSPDVSAWRTLPIGSRFERLAGLPLRAIDGAFPETADIPALLGTSPELRSPMGDLTALHLASACEGAADLSMRLEGLFQRFERDGADFVNLVGCIQRQADEDEAWRAEDPAFAALAMWAWADAIWRMLASINRDPAPLARFWRKAVGLRPRALVFHANRCAAAAPWLSAGRVIACGLPIALKGAPQEVWSAELVPRLARILLGESRRRGPIPLGPLLLSPDRELTWLADTTPFVADDEATAAQIQEAIGGDDAAQLAALAIAGADLLSEASAEALVVRLQSLVGSGDTVRDGGLWLRLTGLVADSLVRREALSPERASSLIDLFVALIARLRQGSDWSRISETAFNVVLKPLSGNLELVSQALERLFLAAPAADRLLLHRITTIYLAAAPFEVRAPIWREQLRQRASI